MITYIPGFLGQPQELLTKLLELDWLSVTETRKEYFMSFVDRTYTYGKGKGVREYKSNPYTPEIEEIVDMLSLYAIDEPIVGGKYNVCFLNRYDTQQNHLGWHSDDFADMDHNHPIAVISLGVAREIWWRKIGETGVVPPENRQLLEPGSLFIMPAGFQHTHQHRIPKHSAECGMRISLTFRKH